ncbi:3-demethylubiquinone-9 3-methyltransferase, putative [Plasmodium sp. gorilla clade G2]|uniref:3-demethylubiquinone-9 3-methyltransferase, putative n=1 Tax=Plasmodium sp. gorilla clade G2 TaxID=880535 RepID=UPI000D21E0A0|nr:3-demethylubiquinone-9 3-methyltransferase, putative [Plasmodium sp. gorilla clade G2]SOV13198.1 3-demethylubiquinone-9 3-methyltransferase, putative [Plasmodium sp. gorilla clade G2]
MKRSLRSIKTLGVNYFMKYERIYHSSNNNTYDEKEKTFFDEQDKEWWNENYDNENNTEENKTCIKRRWNNIFDEIIGRNIYSLHDYNKKRFDFIFKNYEFLYYKDIKDNMNKKEINILDIGCGGGILCEYIEKNIFYFLLKNVHNIDLIKDIKINIDGIDISEKLINVAKKRQQINRNTYKQLHINLNYINCDLSEYVNIHNNNKFKKIYDIIISSEVIEHVPNNKKNIFVSYINQLCTKNTLVVFTTINKNFLAYLYTIMLAENIFRMMKKGTHDYDKYIDNEELDKLCKENNLYNIKTEHVIYLPFFRNYFQTYKLNLLYLSSFVYSENNL